MTLPNLVRLYRRRIAMFEPAGDVAPVVASGAALLTDAYRRQQPVRRQRRLLLRD